MLPWFLNTKFKTFKDVLDTLLKVLYKYHSFLENQKKRSNEVHKSPEPIRSLTDNWSFRIVDTCIGTPDKMHANIDLALQNSDVYCPIDLIDFEPIDRYDRRNWLEKLKLTCAFGIFTYQHGNYLGNLNVVWKQPPMPDRDSARDIQLMNDIKSKITVFATRAMRKDFMEKYVKTVSEKPAVLRSMYRFLTGNVFAPTNSSEESIDLRVSKFLLDSDDPKLILDLRKNNGKIEDKKFEPFWAEVKKYLEEKSVVDDRRHGEISYMPFAISVRDFKEQILARMPPNSIAPSETWIKLNFYPSNPYRKSATQYTGEFQVKHAVQQRLLRVQHEDANFAFNQYTILKSFAVRWRDHSYFQCLDDKAIVPVGEPGRPVGAVNRAHNRGLVSSTGSRLLTLDHDFHICGIIPSVCLMVDIPDNARGSFYRGDLHITLKDKVFQPSHPLRHSAETINILRADSDDGVNSKRPILLRYTDGGPDHRTTYTSVQLASILEFIALDLDMFVACRTAPHQSYNNPAERSMSLLNLGLQNVSLSRAEMETGYESQMKSMSSMNSIRNSKKENFKSAVKESVKATIETVKNIFKRLRKTHGQVFVHDASDEEEISQLLEMIKVLDGNLDSDKAREIKDFSKYPHLFDFVKKHCRKRHYSFQVFFC